MIKAAFCGSLLHLKNSTPPFGFVFSRRFSKREILYVPLKSKVKIFLERISADARFLFQMSQIAKILNSHMDALQWVDHNAGMLVFPLKF